MSKAGAVLHLAQSVRYLPLQSSYICISNIACFCVNRMQKNPFGNLLSLVRYSYLLEQINYLLLHAEATFGGNENLLSLLKLAGWECLLLRVCLRRKKGDSGRGVVATQAQTAFTDSFDWKC